MNSNDNTHDPLQGQQHKDVSMVDVNNLHESLSQMSIDDNSFGSMQGFAPLTRQNDTQTSLNTQSTINSASHTPQPSAQVQNSDYQQQSQADHGNTSGNAATNSPLPPLGRRRSTMIFSDDYDVPEFRENAGTVNDISDDERINHDGVYGGAPNSQTNQQKQATSSNSYSSPNQQFSSSSSSSASFPSRPGSSQQQQQQQQQQERPVLVPVSIKWEQGGNSVYVTGSFTDWRKMIALTKNQEEPHIFSIVLQLPPGNHRFRFIVDGELRISDFLPQATDQLGNIVNFLEVSSPYSSTSMANSSNDSTVVAGTKNNNNNNNNNNDSSAVKRHQGEGSPEYPHKQPGQQSNAYQQQNDQSQYEQQQQQQQQQRGQAANANKRHAYKIAGSGFTSLEDEAKESSTDQQHQHAQMSKSSRLALQIAAENDQEPEDIGNGFSRVRPGDNKPLLSSSSSSKAQYQYTTDIPAVFTDPHVMEQYYLTLDQQRNNQQYMSWLTPPLLPPHLEKVILNASYSTPSTNNLPKQDSNGNNGHQHRHHHHHSHHHRTHQQNSTGSSDSSISSSQMSVDKQPSPQPPANSDENNSGALPIPNHVVLNHLITSSIKHNTLCVACTVRYKSKYATQILYAPL